LVFVSFFILMAVLFWIGSVRMVLFSNSWYLGFMPKLWFTFLLCEEFEISDILF